MDKMTAVEWLKKELEDYGSNSHLSLDWNTFDELCQQAKEMEIDQHKEMFDCGRQFQLTGEGTFKQVHEELYGK